MPQLSEQQKSARARLRSGLTALAADKAATAAFSELLEYHYMRRIASAESVEDWRTERMNRAVARKALQLLLEVANDG